MIQSQPNNFMMLAKSKLTLCKALADLLYGQPGMTHNKHIKQTMQRAPYAKF